MVQENHIQKKVLEGGILPYEREIKTKYNLEEN